MDLDWRGLADGSRPVDSDRGIRADGSRPGDSDRGVWLMGPGRGFRPGQTPTMSPEPFLKLFPYPYEYINCIDLGAAPWCRIYSEKQYTNINRKEACFL